LLKLLRLEVLMVARVTVTAFGDVVSIIRALMMEAASTSETSVNFSDYVAQQPRRQLSSLLKLF
jgi:hypothetical protein